MKADDFYHMILLFSFFNGMITVAVVYYAITIYKVKLAYESMLQYQSSLQNQQTVENQLLREKAEGMEALMMDIQSNMEKDNYSDLSKINNKIRALETVVDNHAKSWVIEQEFERKVQESLSNIKQWMKRMGDDPTLIRGY